ncbi:MerR family transcriptional regulator [Paenibacillus tarimensis]
MDSYTAKQVAELLQRDDPRMNLRTVRYYTQIGMLPPLELVGNKRVYTDRHIEYFRAIMFLSRTGETLASIQDKFKTLSLEEIKKLGDQLHIYRPDRVLENETVKINEDILITISPKISAEMKQKVIESITNVLRGE